MSTIKSYTDLEQSKKLAKILTLESADMYYEWPNKRVHFKDDKYSGMGLSCWSLAALLNVLSEIKPQVYTPILFPGEGKWILQFAEYGHGNVCEVTCDNPVDACYEMILKLHELDLV